MTEVVENIDAVSSKVFLSLVGDVSTLDSRTSGLSSYITDVDTRVTALETDVETALDSILALQESYINGGAN